MDHSPEDLHDSSLAERAVHKEPVEHVDQSMKNTTEQSDDSLMDAMDRFLEDTKHLKEQHPDEASMKKDWNIPSWKEAKYDSSAGDYMESINDLNRNTEKSESKEGKHCVQKQQEEARLGQKHDEQVSAGRQKQNLLSKLAESHQKVRDCSKYANASKNMPESSKSPCPLSDEENNSDAMVAENASPSKKAKMDTINVPVEVTEKREPTSDDKQMEEITEKITKIR